jgi:hypothetical protein
MDDPQQPAVKNKIFVVMPVLLMVAAIYVAGVFYSRWQDNQAVTEREAAAQREKDQEAVDFMNGNRFDILNFYAAPGVIHRGDSTDLCYGVSNAKTVKLEPAVAEVWPSYSRCVRVSPRKNTSYTLTATDAAGHSKSSTVEIEVR